VPRRHGDRRARFAGARKEALRHHEVKVILGASHRDTQESALFLDLRDGSKSLIGK
jgi:hypothetical protein